MTAEAIIVALLLAGFGGLLILVGYGIGRQRFSRRTQFARWYHHQYRVLGWPLRNWPFAALPFGVVALLAAALGLVMPIVPPWSSVDRATGLLWLIVLGAPLIGLFGFLVLSVISLFRPPRWLKPRWLQEDEARLKAGLPSLVPLPPEGDRPVIARWEAAVITLLTFVIPVGVLFFGWPPALLIGLGFTIPIFARARVRSADVEGRKNQ